MLSLGIPNSTSSSNNTNNPNTTSILNGNRKRESDEDYKFEIYGKVQRGKLLFFFVIF